MCRHTSVLYEALKPHHRKIISDSYEGVKIPGIKCVTQFDGSVWILVPLGMSERRVRSMIALSKGRATKLYKTEFPLSALVAA